MALDTHNALGTITWQFWIALISCHLWISFRHKFGFPSSTLGRSLWYIIYLQPYVDKCFHVCVIMCMQCIIYMCVYTCLCFVCNFIFSLLKWLVKANAGLNFYLILRSKPFEWELYIFMLAIPLFILSVWIFSLTFMYGHLVLKSIFSPFHNPACCNNSLHSSCVAFSAFNLENQTWIFHNPMLKQPAGQHPRS